MKKIILGCLLLFIAGCTGIRGYDGSGQVCINTTWMGLSLIEFISPCEKDGYKKEQYTSYQKSNEESNIQIDYQLQFIPKVQVYQQPVRDLEAERYQQKMIDYKNRRYNRYENDYLRYHL